MYDGIYNHSNHSIHPNDLENVLDRAFANHIEKLIVTGTSLSDSSEALKIANKSGSCITLLFYCVYILI
jgi:Tat protein secretion system quality control protein TatD with DNase activity